VPTGSSAAPGRPGLVGRTGFVDIVGVFAAAVFLFGRS